MMKSTIQLIIISLLSCLEGSAQVINTIAGNGTSSHCGDGLPATQACLDTPYNVAFGRAGDLYITEATCYIRKVDHQTGIISTIAGIWPYGFSGDGGQATAAAINHPVGIAFDRIGNLYFSDNNNNRVRKIDTNGIITTVAGNGSRGYNGDGIPATQAALKGPWGLQIDKKGNLYIGDQLNFRIRKVDTAGIITTYAGNGIYGWGGDGGPASSAQLAWTAGFQIDDIGNCYVPMIDTLGSSNTPPYYRTFSKIRKIDTAGIIALFAGDTIGFSGNGGPAIAAKIFITAALNCALDRNGNLFFADSLSRVNMIGTDGIIHTIAGNGVLGFSGDGGTPILAEFNETSGLCTDTSGNLYIVDSGNSRVRKITWNQNASGIAMQRVNQELQVYPNPSTGTIYISGGNSSDKEWIIEVLDITGRALMKQTLPVTNGMAVLKSDLPPGAYFVVLKGSYGNSITKKVIITNQ